MDTPKIYDWPLPAFTLLFISTYISGQVIIFRKWDKKHRSEASSCLMSLVHGTPALILSISSISHSQSQTTKNNFTSPNTPFHNTVLDYSIAYFITDLLHYLIMAPSDLLFIAHHLATLYVLLTCRYLFQHGAVAILGILALAESTSTCQNTWSLARLRKLDSPRAAAVFELMSPLFYGYYSVVRGVAGPLFVWKMGMVFGSGVIPRWAWGSWMAVILVGIGVSMLWVLHLWIDLCRQRWNSEMKKLK